MGTDGWLYGWLYRWIYGNITHIVITFSRHMLFIRCELLCVLLCLMFISSGCFLADDAIGASSLIYSPTHHVTPIKTAIPLANLAIDLQSACDYAWQYLDRNQ